MKSKRQLDLERAKKLIILHDKELFTFRELGQIFNVTKQRAHQIYQKHKQD